MAYSCLLVNKSIEILYEMCLDYRSRMECIFLIIWHADNTHTHTTTRKKNKNKLFIAENLLTISTSSVTLSALSSFQWTFFFLLLFAFFHFTQSWVFMLLCSCASVRTIRWSNCYSNIFYICFHQIDCFVLQMLCSTVVYVVMCEWSGWA